MKKKIGGIITIVLFVCMSIACGGNDKTQPSFDATVLEVYDKYIIVEPVAGEDELNSADRIQVSKTVVSTDGAPDMQIGDEIRIVYNGEIMESYPAKLGTVFAIYLKSELDG